MFFVVDCVVGICSWVGDTIWFVRCAVIACCCCFAVICLVCFLVISLNVCTFTGVFKSLIVALVNIVVTYIAVVVVVLVTVYIIAIVVVIVVDLNCIAMDM